MEEAASSNAMKVLSVLEIAAENPASIAMAIGGAMIAFGRGEGWLLVLIGAALNAYWIAEK